MTIAAGFVCSDGIVLCSDTLISSDHRRYGPKLWVHPASDVNWSVVVTGSGMHDDVVGLKDSIFASVTWTTPPEELRSRIEEQIANYLKDHRPTDQTYTANLLIAIRAAGESVLLGHTESKCARIPDYRCIGGGRHLGSYLAGKFYQDDLSMGSAQLIAGMIVLEAIDYVEGCGGDVSIVSIPLEEGDVGTIFGKKFGDRRIDHLSSLVSQFVMVVHADMSYDDPRFVTPNDLHGQLRQFVNAAQRGLELRTNPDASWGGLVSVGEHAFAFGEALKKIEQDETERRRSAEERRQARVDRDHTHS